MPNKTRIALVLAIVLALLVCSLPVYSASENPDSENPEAVFLSEKGIMVGDPGGDLMLERNFTIEQLMTVLARLAGKEDEAKAFSPLDNFKDVPLNRWSAPYIAWSKANGISKGNPEGTIGYADNVTAQRLAAFLLRTLGYTDVLWNDVWSLSRLLGLINIEGMEPGDAVIRGDVARIVYAALHTQTRSGEKLGVKLGIIESSEDIFPENPEESESYGKVEYDNAKYYGELKDNIPHGKGTLVWDSGDIYTGEFADGYRSGFGLYRWPDGDYYLGEFLQDKIEGKGTYYWANGDIYTGQWKNDNMDGEGTLTFADGIQYSGQWKEGFFQSGITPPQKVRAYAVSSSEIEIGWDKVEGAEYYYIYYTDNPDGEWHYFSDEEGRKSPQQWLGDYSSILTGCNANTTYYFKITAVVDGFESLYSNTVSATTKAEN